jgi:hypothetical protein
LGSAAREKGRACTVFQGMCDGYLLLVRPPPLSACLPPCMSLGMCPHGLPSAQKSGLGTEWKEGEHKVCVCVGRLSARDRSHMRFVPACLHRDLPIARTHASTSKLALSSIRCLCPRTCTREETLAAAGSPRPSRQMPGKELCVHARARACCHDCGKLTSHTFRADQHVKLRLRIFIHTNPLRRERGTRVSCFERVRVRVRAARWLRVCVCPFSVATLQDIPTAATRTEYPTAATHTSS